MSIIRTVELEDAEKLVNIYRPYVEHTAITFDYTVPSVHEFEEKISKTIQSYPFLVVVEGDDFRAYMRKEIDALTEKNV